MFIKEIHWRCSLLRTSKSIFAAVWNQNNWNFLLKILPVCVYLCDLKISPISNVKKAKKREKQNSIIQIYSKVGPCGRGLQIYFRLHLMRRTLQGLLLRKVETTLKQCSRIDQCEASVLWRLEIVDYRSTSSRRDQNSTINQCRNDVVCLLGKKTIEVYSIRLSYLMLAKLKFNSY